MTLEEFESEVADLQERNYPLFLKYERFFEANPIKGMAAHRIASLWMKADCEDMAREKFYVTT